VSKKQDKKAKDDFLLGGQAVIEGVLMRSPNYYTVAVRKASGEIVLQRRHKPRITDRHPVLGWPVVRGVMLLAQTLGIGISALNFSADVLAAEEEEKKGKGEKRRKKKKEGLSRTAMALTLIAALAVAFLMIVFLPLWLTDLVKAVLPAVGNPLLYNLVDGIFRVIIFLLYILLISLLPDIRRVFQYHGAEHMSVHARERKAGELSVEAAGGLSPYHPRCGTSFLLLVMIVAILIFSLTPTNEPFWIKLLIRTPLIPLIAGVSYEVLKLTARLQKGLLFRILSAPGLWLQRLTARRPDDKQLAVAVTALKDVIDLENRFGGDPIPAELESGLIPADS
jgi:uncharacterized protein YqhQ